DPTGNFGISSITTAINSAVRLTLSTSVNIARAIGNKVGQSSIRTVSSIRLRVWMIRNVNQVQAKLPKHIFGKGKISRNGKGWRWGDAKNNIRVQRGNPNAKHASQKVDYVQIRAEGKGIIGRNGKPVSSKFTDDAHIPLSEWRTGARWDSPT
ncbi:MAG: hypothetical protein P8104_03900, partial [Gammaproteobacteria bacterium]